MRAPYVSLENAPAVTEYFTQKKPSWPLLRVVVHPVMGQVFRVMTHYEDGAEEEIRADLAAGKQLFLAHNHQQFVDPLILASMLQREKMLRSMRTKAVIPAKSPLFNKWYGWVIRNGGAVPVFRPQEDLDMLSKAEQAEARRKANAPLIAIMQTHLNQGLHGAIYPEGTRGKNDGKVTEAPETVERDLTQLLPIQKGIGTIACGLNDPENISIVCIGTMYGATMDDLRHPTSYVMRPFSVAETPEAVAAHTGVILQQAVDAAVALVM